MKLNFLAAALHYLAIIFLALTAGIVIALTQVWPYPIVHDAYRAAVAQWQQTEDANPLFTDLWRVARTPARGVTIKDTARMQPGYTLYTSGDSSVARLIDANGHVVHQWQLPFSKVWTKNAAVKNPQADDLIYMRRARLLANGNLLAMYISGNDTPWGYGLVELDPSSHIVWRYLQHVHHDLDLTNDGRVVTLTHDFTSKPLPPRFSFVPRPYLEDFLVTLSPDGKQLSKISIMDMLVHSPYGIALRRSEPWFADFDPLHVNSVDWLGPKQIKALGFGRPGDVLLMLRQLNLLILVDPQAKQIVWGIHGNWLDPHDPHVLPNGHILMFDNLGNMKPHNRSRVIEFDPHTDKVEWSYEGSQQHPLDSSIRGMDQRLANGNTLITESDGGRLLEVTASGDIVWEYINPIRAGKDNRFIPVVSGGMRIDPASLDPDFRALLKSAAKNPGTQ
ncbi:MAG: hypothetical protein PF501_05960 [Salinisphaera sp.]|jgi:hypothetical protein|nr:hypothetical protein [Salinisphaera sp.]